MTWRKENAMGTSEHIRSAAGGAASSAAGTVRDKAGTVRDRLSEVGSTAGEKVQDTAGMVRHAPRAVVTQARGNPLAAGIIAFGVGMLAATLLPVTDAERRAGQELRDRGEPLTDRVKDVANDLRTDQSSTVQEAVGEVTDTARDAARTTRQQAQSSVQDATRQTRQPAGTPPS